MNIENNGHTFKLNLRYRNNVVPTLSGGPLADNYKLVEIHYHFGATNHHGSEHTIDGRRSTAEGHMVFYNTKYQSFKNAQNKPDGLAVIARLFEETQSPNYHYKFVQYLRDIQQTRSSRGIGNPKFNLMNLFGEFNFSYYSYDGSLTTPPCFESVTWIVISKPMKMYSRDLKIMRHLNGSDGKIAPNFRPLQDGNGREIEFYKNN